MADNKHIRIGELARSSGVTIRALHFYENIGLLMPGRMSNGYRVYSPQDLLRLQQILIQKSLGFSLEQIKSVLDNPDFDYLTTLKQQRVQLEAQIALNQSRIHAIDAAITKITTKDNIMADTSLFSGFDPEIYQKETEVKWGQSTAFKESQKRVSRYSEKDWLEMKSELDQIWTEAAQLMQAGVGAESKEAFSIVERHREHVERWFYPCSRTMQIGLADMWLADDRFRANIDRFGAGLTVWLSTAIKA